MTQDATVDNPNGVGYFGVIALAFQVIGVLMTGWGFLLLACLGYVPGFFFSKRARQEAGETLAKSDWIFIAVFAVFAAISIPLTVMGVILVFWRPPEFVPFD